MCTPLFRLLHLLKPRTRDNNSHPRTHVSLTWTPNALPLTPREIWKEEDQGGEEGKEMLNRNGGDDARAVLDPAAQSSPQRR